MHHAYSYRLLHHTIARLASYNDLTALNSYSSYAGIDVRITTILRTWNSYSDKSIVYAAKINITCMDVRVTKASGCGYGCNDQCSDQVLHTQRLSSMKHRAMPARIQL